jgi:hypothetical protein
MLAARRSVGDAKLETEPRVLPDFVDLFDLLPMGMRAVLFISHLDCPKGAAPGTMMIHLGRSVINGSLVACDFDAFALREISIGRSYEASNYRRRR